MAEAIAIISLLGNIVQFVDTGTKVLSSTYELYKKGSLEENSELSSTTGCLQGALELLQNGPMVKSDTRLSALVLGCSQLADELMAILDKLKPDKRKNVLLESTLKSLHSVKARGKIKDIERRLNKMKDDLCFRLNVILRSLFILFWVF